MTKDEAKTLKIGEQVETTQLPLGELHVGDVIDANWMAATIKWDDGQVGIVDFRDMGLIHRHDPIAQRNAEDEAGAAMACNDHDGLS